MPSRVPSVRDRLPPGLTLARVRDSLLSPVHHNGLGLSRSAVFEKALIV